MTNETKTMLRAEIRPQMDDVRKFLDTLDRDGQRSLLDFFQGARFMQSLMLSLQAGERKRPE